MTLYSAVACTSVTLILPVRNEIKHIGRSLSAVARQDYAGKLEILVVDGMSTDGTRETIAHMAAEHPNVWIELIDNPGGIVPTGLNIAIRKSTGKIIIRVDGHCVIATDFVRRCVQYIENDEVDCVGGSIITTGVARIARVTAIAMSSRFGVGDSAFRTLTGQTMFTDTVPFPAYSRRLIQRVGLYDEELACNEDDEYNYRVREMGGRILLAADVHSEYYSRGSWGQLWRQYFRYGYWKVRVLQKHPHQMRARQFVPPFFVASLLASMLLWAIAPSAFAVMAVVAGAYLITNLLASVWLCSKRGWCNLPLLPITFAVLHLGYGSGFLLGMVKFWNRWRDRVGRVPKWSPGQLTFESGSEPALVGGDRGQEQPMRVKET